MVLSCYDCGYNYNRPDWVEAVVPDEVWEKIAPNEEGGGILCIHCMSKRMVEAGIRSTVVITAGPMLSESAIPIEGR